MYVKYSNSAFLFEKNPVSYTDVSPLPPNDWQEKVKNSSWRTEATFLFLGVFEFFLSDKNSHFDKRKYMYIYFQHKYDKSQSCPF